MIFLIMQVFIENRSKMIHIHNIYNLSSLSYSLTKSFSMLSKVKRHLIDCESHQILLSDFKLHHSLWNELIRFIQHATANQWLNLIENLNFFFTLLIDIIIWEARNMQSTINLIFMIELLANRVIHCNIRLNLNQSSNHISILISLILNSETNIIFSRRTWKSMNWKRIKQKKLHASSSIHSRFVVKIN
jgi:hypothetical protein